MTRFEFDAHVGECGFDREGRAWFALGDGRVCRDDSLSFQAHEGAILCQAAHPAGAGVLSGGEDGRLAWTSAGGATTLYARPGRWIDAVDASTASGLYAFSNGREVQVRDVADPSFERRFVHERSAAALAFDAKGRRLAVATYGGVALWYARIAEQTPQTLRWAGSHIGVAWSPDGRFLVSAMQENALHGWRLSDVKDMRMGGYPSKVRSLAFLSKGRMLATSGASGAVLWPFAGGDGPMGKSATEIGVRAEGLATRVAASVDAERLVLGWSDGAVRLLDLRSGEDREIAAPGGGPISALAMSADGSQAAFGDEGGGAAVVAL